MQRDKIDCAAWLKSSANGEVIYWVPNYGNAGDCLIAASTASLFRRQRIKFRSVSNPAKFSSNGKFICYGCGGSRKGIWRFLQKHHESATRLVVLPHTLRENEDVLAALSSRVTIICREAVSYAHCEAYARKAEILMADDLALALRPQELLTWQIIQSALAAPVTWLSMNKAFAKLTKETLGR